MLVFGLTGNTGTGKTTVARMFAEWGVGVVDADQLARQVVEKGQPALREIAGAFGAEFLSAEGDLRRKELGRLIFTDPKAKAVLEQITHPRIAALAQGELAALRKDGAELAVYDSAILVETGMAGAFDGLILVAASKATQLARITARDTLSKKDALARIEAQMSLSKKREVADVVIENDGDLDDLRTRVNEVLGWMKRVAE